MAVTAWHSPGTVSDVARSGSIGGWSNVDNVKESDDTDATRALVGTGYTDWVRCENFGFTIDEVPSGAIITKIEVGIEKAVDGFDAKDSSLRLRKSTGQVGDDKADTASWWPLADAYIYYEWNDTEIGTINDVDIRSSSLGIDFSAYLTPSGEAWVYIDHIRLRAYWYYPGAPVFLKGGLTGVFGKSGFLLGSLTAQLQYFGWILGNPVMQSFPQKRFLVGDAITTWGKKGFLQGSLNPYYGDGGYLVGTLTAIPYYPKPVAGSWFQRTEAVVEKIT